jgi:hypothetical protein
MDAVLSKIRKCSKQIELQRQISYRVVRDEFICPMRFRHTVTCPKWIFVVVACLVGPSGEALEQLSARDTGN